MEHLGHGSELEGVIGWGAGTSLNQMCRFQLSLHFRDSGAGRIILITNLPSAWDQADSHAGICTPQDLMLL